MKLILIIFITAIIVGSGTYYFSSNNNIGSSIITPTTNSKSNIVFNQSSKEYATMGQKVWSVFQCSAWASEMDNFEESERLFLFGYEKGKKFIGALNNQKIKQEDLSSKVPIIVKMLLRGPSEDFIIGRIYSSAEEDALADVFFTDKEYNSDEIQKLIARNKYADGNCQLIGR